MCCNRLQPIAVLAGETVSLDETIFSGESPRPYDRRSQVFAKSREYNACDFTIQLLIIHFFYSNNLRVSVSRTSHCGYVIYDVHDTT